MARKKKLKIEEENPDQAEEGNGEDLIPQEIPAPEEPSISPSPQEPPQPPLSQTGPGQETVNLPLESVRAMALELAQMRAELDQLKQGQIVPGMVPGSGATTISSAPRTRMDALIDTLGQVAAAAGKFIPQQSGGLNDRFMNMLFDGLGENIEIARMVKLGVAKQLGVEVVQPVKHMTVVE